MKTRKEAVELIKKQFTEGRPEDKTFFGKRPKGNQFHYGRQELRDLLDYIYGGPPSNESEEIRSDQS